MIVSGTGEPRADFARASTAPLDVLDAVTTYLVLGGDRNVAECAKFLSDRLELTGYGSEPPLPVPEHGVYLRDVEHATIADWERTIDASKPTAAVLFYRAHLLSGNTAFVDALAEALEARGFNVLAVFTSSLRALDDGVPRAAPDPADVFELSQRPRRRAARRAACYDAVVRAGRGECRRDHESGWSRAGVRAARHPGDSGDRERHGARGLGSVAPRIDGARYRDQRRDSGVRRTADHRADFVQGPIGRVLSLEWWGHDGGAGDRPGLYAPHVERVERVAGIAARLARLRHLPRRDMRVAFILTNSSSKAAQVGNAVGLDAPASLLHLLHAMQARGYAIDEARLPAASDELMADLLARGSYDDLHPLDESQAMRFGRARYKAEFDRLPEAARKRMIDWWGEPAAHGFARRDPNRKIDKKIAPPLKPAPSGSGRSGRGRSASDEPPSRGAIATAICSRRFRSATRSSRSSRRAATA